MAVNIQKFLPPAKSYGNIEKYSRATNEITPAIGENLSVITVKVIEVDKILKGTLALDKKKLDDKKKEDNLNKRQKAEESLEKKPDKKEFGKLSLPKLPQMGFFDWIKNFISTMIIGFFALRLIEHLPKLRGILSLIGKATDLAIDLGGKYLNALVTFVDWGYKAYDATRGFLKNLGGENFAKTFDGFVNVIDDLIEAAIIASIAINSFGDDRGSGIDVDGGTKSPIKTGKELYKEYDPKRSLIRKNYGDAAAKIYDNEISNGKNPRDALRNVRQRYISKGRIKPERVLRLGEIKGSKVFNRGLQKAPQRIATKALAATFGKGGAKTVLKFIRPFLKRIPIPIVGALIDFGLSVALGESPGKAAFKAIGSGLAGIIGTAIGSIPPLIPFGGPFIGAAIGGWAGDALGGALYESFFEKKPQKKTTEKTKPKVQGRAEGGEINSNSIIGSFGKLHLPGQSFDYHESSQIFNSGLVRGQKGVDKIPTMLPEGAFVMSRGAVQKHGINTLESMNASSDGRNKVTNKTTNIFKTANSYITERQFNPIGSSVGSMFGPLGMLISSLSQSDAVQSVISGVGGLPKMFADGGVARGVSTRGGEYQGGVERTFKKQKYKREIAKKPSEVKIDSPGSDVGGEEKIMNLFPNPIELLRGKTDKKPEEYTNPFNIIKGTGETLGKSDYFGPILAITSKILLGQEPDQKDYKNVGLGINFLISKGIDDGKLMGGVVAAFAEGGPVDPETISTINEGGNITDWIANAFKEATETNAQKTLREIQKNLNLKKPEDEKTPPPSPDDMNIEDGYGEGGIATGLGVNKGVSVAKKLIADLGITPAQAAGIVGNFLYESAGMNPGEREGAPYGTPESPPSLGTLGVGYGWAQWTNSAPGDRLDKFLKSYGGDKGKIATDNDNYRYLMKELKGSESLKGMPTDDPQAASDWFRVNWERAGIPADKKRRKETLAVFDKIKGLTREQAKADVMKAGAIYSDKNLAGGNGKFIQGNSGASGGVHFHIGPGTQPGQVDTKYNADARKAAQQVVKHFLGKKSLYDGRRGASYTSGSDEEIMAAQKAHSANGGSQGGIDIQVGGAHPGAATRIPFPFAVTNMAERPGGFGVSAKIAGLNAFVAHGRYNEKGKLATQLGTRSSPPFTTAEGYAFHGRSFGIVPKGGMRLTLHEGELFKVVDKDSVDLFGYDLTKEIIDIENKAQLVAKAPSIIEKLKTISGYAPYEDQQQTVVVDEGPGYTSYQENSFTGASGVSGYSFENAIQDSNYSMFESIYASR